jgi:hypothetical protein
MYSIDCEMLSKKKGNITATLRKARKTKQRYRRSGKKPPSRIEKNSSAVCKERDLNNKKKRKALAEMFNLTPESPDTSDFNENLSDVNKKSKKLESENAFEHQQLDQQNNSPSSKKELDFSPQLSSALKSSSGLSPVPGSPQLSDYNGSSKLSLSTPQRSQNSTVTSQRTSSIVGSPKLIESPQIPTTSKSSLAEEQLALRRTRRLSVCS